MIGKAFLVLLALVTIACCDGGSSSSIPGKQVSGGIVTARLDADWATGFDPAISQSLAGGEEQRSEAGSPESRR